MGMFTRSVVSKLVFLLALVRLDKVAAIESKEARTACPYYQNMQCLLDISEKACEPDESPIELLQWNAQESIWLCCCPLPYKACKKEEMDTKCIEVVKEHLPSTITERAQMVIGLQKARGLMRKAGGDKCTALAPEEPLSVCGFEAAIKKQRSLDRED